MRDGIETVEVERWNGAMPKLATGLTREAVARLAAVLTAASGACCFSTACQLLKSLRNCSSPLPLAGLAAWAARSGAAMSALALLLARAGLATNSAEAAARVAVTVRTEAKIVSRTTR